MLNITKQFNIRTFISPDVKHCHYNNTVAYTGIPFVFLDKIDLFFPNRVRTGIDVPQNHNRICANNAKFI